jgi:hypothetical protein
MLEDCIFFILLFETGTKGAYFGFIFIVIPSLRPLWQSTTGELGRDSVPHDPAFHPLHQGVADEQIQVWHHSMKIQIAGTKPQGHGGTKRS